MELPNLTNQQELYKLLRAWDGKRPYLPLSREQELRAAYLVASKRPCYVCGESPFSMWNKTIPEAAEVHGGKLFIYGLCKRCHDAPERENMVWALIESDITEWRTSGSPNTET